MGDEDAKPDVPSAAPVRRRIIGHGNGGIHGAFYLNEEVSDKLKILDYETSFCEANDMIPFPKTYFAMGSGAGQFDNFMFLAKWLFREANREFTTDKFDDPNTSVNKLMLELKNIGFEMDFPASKLRAAYGEAVCRVLNFLCDQALISHGFRWQNPVYPEEDFAEEAEVDEEAEVAAEVEDATDEIEEDEVLYSEVVAADAKFEFDEEEHGVMEATVDPVEWRTELERVAPKLKIVHQFSGKEWRAHLEQTQKHEKTILGVFPETQGALNKIGNEAGNMLQRVANKEKYLNNQFDSYADEYRQAHEQLKTSQEEYQTTNQRVTKLTQELSGVVDMLEEVKGQMDERGNDMTDTSPLVKIKQGLAKLKMEIKTMDLRIGVVGHTLMQAKIRHKASPSGGVAAGRDDDVDFDIDDDDDLSFNK